jgi:hypothetical protein
VWALSNLTQSQPPPPVEDMIQCLTNICKNTYVRDSDCRLESWVALDYHSRHDVPERTLYIDLMVGFDVFARWTEIPTHSTSTITALCNVLDFGSHATAVKVMHTANAAAVIIADYKMKMTTHRGITKHKALKRLRASLVRLLIPKAQ